MLMGLGLLIGLMLGAVIIVKWELLVVGLMICGLLMCGWGKMAWDTSIEVGSFGVDLMGVGLCWLSVWIGALMLLASVRVVKQNFVLVLLSGLCLLLFVFSSFSYLMFYIAFESVLIPIFVLVVGWGYQPERLQAGVYLIFYTVFASLPLLLVILYWEGIYGGMFFGGLVPVEREVIGPEAVVCVGGMMAFLVSAPLFAVHLWLPKAHVEAPISGSMVLAGVLLKMGGFGLMRMSEMYAWGMSMFSSFWISLGVGGGLYLSLGCLRQWDLKALIAYSSVVHMGLVIGGVMSLSSLGFLGSYIMMVGHGLCSSGLFCLANLSYERLGSRSVLLNKGMISLIPSGSLVWFLLVSSNMSAPPSLNLVGEISLIGSILGWSVASIGGLILMAFFSAAYSLYLFTSSQHGMSLGCVGGTSSYSSLEYLLLMLHWLPLNLLFLKCDVFMI